MYDLKRNEGWASVGIDHDAASFAVDAIRRWWKLMGHPAYRGATSLLVTADAGGSNGPRVRLWKWELQQFANRTGLPITVCPFPPGTSKWIEASTEKPLCSVEHVSCAPLVEELSLHRGLDALRDAARDGLIDRVLMHDPDRLSRKYACQVLQLEEFRRWHVEVRFLKQPPAESDEHRLLVQIRGVIAERPREGMFFAELERNIDEVCRSLSGRLQAMGMNARMSLCRDLIDKVVVGVRHRGNPPQAPGVRQLQHKKRTP